MKPFIDTILEPALWFAVDWSLRWGALLTVVALILWIFRPHRATIRELILKAALLAGLLIPFSPRWGDGWKWPHLPKPSIPSSQSVPPTPPSSAWERTSGSIASPAQRQPGAKQSIATAHSQAELGNEETQSESLDSRRLIVLGLFSCWCFVVMWKLLRRLGAWFFLRRLRRESVAVTGAAADLFAACRAEMGVRVAVQLATHPHVRSPILLGWMRPQILVSPEWSQSSLESQRAGLLHELAHVRRRDHLLAPLLEILRLTFFFHPFVRWLLARLESEREWLCDEMVVRLGIDRRAYARVLLEFARSSGRLSWFAVSLSMSQRRTVKGRIYHLLEEDMERWIRPVPARWTVALVVGLLGLSLGLASYRVWAEEKEKPALTADKPEHQPASKKRVEPAVKREDLRYADKDFYQWRRDLLTELKPSIRADGMKALGAFGVNGYGSEATRTILEMMRGYDPDIANGVDEDSPVVKAAFLAIEKIGAASVPTLTAAVQEDNRNVRRFAMSALATFEDIAQPALPVLLRCIKNTDLETRECAIQTVGCIGQGNKEAVAALRAELNDPNADIRTAVVRSLGRLGQSASPTVPAILRALSDTDAVVRDAAIDALPMIVGDAKAVTAISSLVQDKEKFVRDSAFAFLNRLGASEAARQAAPALIAALKEPDLDVRVIELLEGMGPAAKEAVPALKELLRSEDQGVRNRARAAYEALSPYTKR